MCKQIEVPTTQVMTKHTNTHARTHKVRLPGRDTKGTAIPMSVDTSAIYIRSQSTLSHPLYTHTRIHTHIGTHPSFMKSELVFASFHQVDGRRVGLNDPDIFFLYAHDKSLRGHTFKFHLSRALVAEVELQ